MPQERRDMRGPATDRPILEVTNLRISFPTSNGAPNVPVDGVTFQVGRGERVGLVGESGSGKSLTALSLLGLVDKVGGNVDPASSIRVAGEELNGMRERDLCFIRGRDIAMVFQDPLTGLNPVYTVGHQVMESLLLHGRSANRREAREAAVDLFASVRLRQPSRLITSYPHELSGGMRQRVLIAMALASDPAVLVADEPTTALDVTVQAGILDLLTEIADTRDLAVLLITHDLGIVAGFTNRCLVMYSGRIVEESATDDLFRDPRHRYTQALLRSIPPLHDRPDRLIAIPGAPPEPDQRPTGCAFHPRCEMADGSRCTVETPLLARGPGDRSVACHYVAPPSNSPAARQPRVGHPDTRRKSSDPNAAVVLKVEHLTKRYRLRSSGAFASSYLDAAKDVSFEIRQGEAFGLVGESGSGKTTVARCIMQFLDYDGRILLDGDDLATTTRAELRRRRANFQMVFQDPTSSLDPRMSVREILAEPLRVHGRWGRSGEDRLKELLDMVSLSASALDRYVHQFSGGQRQRIAIARALALAPKLLVCDEPVSSLDVSVRSSVLNLLADLQRDLGLTMLFIAHDLALMRFLCPRIGVMHSGSLVEVADNETLFTHPAHEHTRALLAAQPTPDPAAERARRRARREAASFGASA